MISKCKLCHRVCDIQNSHIIPKFVGKWLKESSATGYFMTLNVDGQVKRSQDIEKKPLLCKKCEGILNDFETYFANNIFYPSVVDYLESYYGDYWSDELTDISMEICDNCGTLDSFLSHQYP